MLDLRDTLARYLADRDSGFTIGSLGTVAEFFHVAGENAAVGAAGRLSAVTARGGIRIELGPDVRPLAYESLNASRDRWQHGVLLTRPTAAAARPGRRQLTELGPDAHALRAGDRSAVLFDLGLGAANHDFCVRTADPPLLRLLRRHAGASLLDDSRGIMESLVDASPHRVALSALGRIEVFQPLDRTRSPEGPHTHVLPRLIRAGRVVSTNIPLPAGRLPCMALHPAHPLTDLLGREIIFEPARHAVFQELLAAWGDPSQAAEKRRLWDALAAGTAPEAYTPPAGRYTKQAFRVALRQAAQMPETAAAARAWRAVYDRPKNHARTDPAEGGNP